MQAQWCVCSILYHAEIVLIPRPQWLDYFCSFFDSDLAWRVPLSAQCLIGLFLAVGSLAMPESPRWLLDTDRDAEGMRVIADLHGGDPDDVIAKAEFAEIKERIMIEVSQAVP